MNLKIIFSFLVLMLTVNTAFASFPVQRQARTADSQTEVSVSTNEEEEVITPVAGSQKSQGIALILALLLGFLAAHRWYLGKPWYFNVLFIITLGGLGIWWIIDIVRIITGDLTPDNGSYKSDFF